jgi:hypothetical protein
VGAGSTIFKALAAFGLGYAAVKAIQESRDNPPARGSILPPQRPLPNIPFVSPASFFSSQNRPPSPVMAPSMPGIRQPISFVRDRPTPITPTRTAAMISSPTWKKLPAVFALKKGGNYLATLALSGLEKTFATEGIIADRFKAAGFIDVQAFTTSTPPNIPYEAAGAGGPWVKGQWSGNDGEVAQLPSQVANVWILEEKIA